MLSHFNSTITTGICTKYSILILTPTTLHWIYEIITQMATSCNAFLVHNCGSNTVAAAKKSGINLYELENYPSQTEWRKQNIPVLTPDSNTTQVYVAVKL